MTAHLNVPPPKMIEREFRFRYRAELAHQSIEQINAFAKFAETRGAKVFSSHPPLPREIFEPHRAELELLEATLRSDLNTPILENVEEMTFPINDFFETYYHLAGPGVDKRSALLAERMARQAGAAGPGRPPQ